MCECLHVCMVCKHGHRRATRHMWRSEVSSQTSPSPEAELGLSGSQGKYTYLWDHLTSPKSIFNIPRQLSEGTLKIAVDERENKETRQLVKKKTTLF